MEYGKQEGYVKAVQDLLKKWDFDIIDKDNLSEITERLQLGRLTDKAKESTLREWGWQDRSPLDDDEKFYVYEIFDTRERNEEGDSYFEDKAENTMTATDFFKVTQAFEYLFQS